MILSGGEAMSHEDRLTAMAECFIEEFARMGYSDSALLAVFQNPFYQGPHLAYQAFGEAGVRRLIAGVREEADRVAT